jgi:intracellular sulfur oxidation DsrE/DsrF family protein
MLAFVACGNAIARYRSAGLDVTLVPEARVERTAVEHIVDRVRQGWTYLKI